MMGHANVIKRNNVLPPTSNFEPFAPSLTRAVLIYPRAVDQLITTRRLEAGATFEKVAHVRGARDRSLTSHTAAPNDTAAPTTPHTTLPTPHVASTALLLPSSHWYVTFPRATGPTAALELDIGVAVPNAHRVHSLGWFASRAAIVLGSFSGTSRLAV